MLLKKGNTFILAPPIYEGEFFNYKGSNKVVLIAVVDHDYCLCYVYVGAIRRNSNGRISETKQHSVAKNNKKYSVTYYPEHVESLNIRCAGKQV